MSQNITDADQFDDPCTEAANGDDVDGPTRLIHGQKWSNRTFFLKNRVYGAEDADLIWLPFNGPLITANWSFGTSAGGALSMLQGSVVAAYAVAWELPQPKDATLTDIVVFLRGAAGHGGVLPTTVPKLTLFAQDYTADSAPTTVATQSDTSASAAAYETLHTIQMTGLTSALLNEGSIRYYVQLEGETGGSAQAGLAVLDIHGLVDKT